MAEHGLVVGRVAHVHPAFAFRIKVAREQTLHHPARAAELGVAAEPAVDVNRADGCVHAFGAHQCDHRGDLRWRQVRELAVVDRDVGDAPGAVPRQRAARHFAQHARGHLAQPLRVAPARGFVLHIVDGEPARIVTHQRHRAVLGDDGFDRPGQRERCAPAHRPAGDRDHRQPGGAQRHQRTQRIGRDRARGRQRVVDVGQHAQHRLQRGGGRVGPRPWRWVAHASSLAQGSGAPIHSRGPGTPGPAQRPQAR